METVGEHAIVIHRHVSPVTHTKLAPPIGLEQITFVQSFYYLASYKVVCASSTTTTFTDLTF